MPLVRRAVAEFLGTFGLVFFCCGSVVATALPGTDLTLVGVALTQALALSIMVTATMNISGAHLNPAVTVGFLAARRITPNDAWVYVIFQLAGGLAGAMLVKALMPTAAVLATAAGTPSLQSGISLAGAIALEAVLTFFLMVAIYGTAVAPTAPKVGGFGIGLTLFFLIVVGGNLTGAAMNPARAFGPAVISGMYVGQAVYWIGPVIGALVAMVVWERLLLAPEAPAADA